MDIRNNLISSGFYCKNRNLAYNQYRNMASRLKRELLKLGYNWIEKTSTEKTLKLKIEKSGA